MAAFLRAQGSDVRSVTEMGLKGASDAKLAQLAEQLGAKVVTRDRGRQMDGGFGRNAIQINSKIKSFAAILRIITGK
ncbi:DUF5615 family PIN-like protein [Nonomuraea sp. NPDC049758]|uniref:DUF5615 family PIN-like protein n=1 Tax=Nonomuraea sp. NPDC049758 TaxID=3154360 RepID=UPI00342D9969